MSSWHGSRAPVALCGLFAACLLSLQGVSASAVTLPEAKGRFPSRPPAAEADWPAGKHPVIAKAVVIDGALTDDDLSHPTDGSRVDIWQIEGKRGELLLAEMRSETLDSFLFVTTAANPLHVLDGDGDGGPRVGAGERDAALAYEFPEDGTYLLIANCRREDERGSYRLSVRIDPPLEIGGPRAKAGRFAVIAAIDDYPGRLQDLRGPTVDAELMRDTLIQRYGFEEKNVLVLLDKRASRYNLLRAMREHLGRAGEDGVAVLYYSGHGVQLEENLGIQDPEENGVDEALYLADGQILLDDEIGYLASELTAGSILTVFDSCHSGGTNMGSAEQPLSKSVTTADVKGFLRLPARFDLPTEGGKAITGDFVGAPERQIFLAAAQADELAWTLPSWEQLDGRPASVFTVALWEELSREGNDSLEAAFERIQERTADFLAPINKFQEPALLGGERRSQPVADLIGR